MTTATTTLHSGALRQALLQRTRQAVAGGALHTIETEQRLIVDQGVEFLVRTVSSLRRKQKDKKQRERAGGATTNPFLPPEPDLTVGAIGPDHYAVLNKFNVLENHLLIVTRHFEHQETLLTPADFAALAFCLQEIDGLGFYNGGAEAGASQTHKHLQLVPLPLAADLPGTPMESLFPSDGKAQTPFQLPQLWFEHRFTRLDADFWRDCSDVPERLHGLYRNMLGDCGIGECDGDSLPRQTAPYNLLVRRDWMLLVPRSAEHCGGISINALGYAGSLFVRNAAEMAFVQRQGPMRILSAVARPLQASA